MLVSTAQAAKLVGVGTKRITDMRDQGLLNPGRRGRWKLVDVIAAREKMHNQARANLKGESAAQRATNARTNEIELRIARQERRLIPTDEVRDLFEDIVGSFVTSLSSLPTRITRNKRERDRIDRIIDQERTRLADEFEQKASDIEAGGGASKAKRAA